MPRGQLEPVLVYLRRVTGVAALRELPDEQLLERYVVTHDEPAFTELVRRYGRLVRSVCWRILHHEQDVDDAFQATFLIFSSKVRSIRKTSSLASWLYGVAYRTAMNAKRARLRRKEEQKEPRGASKEQPLLEAALREVQAILDEEVNRLPEKYRAVFVVCCLEGKSKTETAQQLGWKEGTVSSRLARARKELQQRLARRGVTLAAALCAIELSRIAAAAGVATALLKATIKAGLSHGAGKVALADLVSAEVAALVKGALPGLLTTKLKIATALLLGGSVLAAGAGTLTLPGMAEPQSAMPNQRPRTPAGPVAAALLRSHEQADPSMRSALAEDKLTPQAPAKPVNAEERCVSWIEQATLKGSGRPVWSAAFSPDGRLLVTGAGGTVEKAGELRIWDAATDQVLVSTPTLRSVRAVAFAPDGKLFATAEFDGTAKLRDSRTGTVWSTMPHVHVGVNAVAFSPDGEFLATGSWDKTIQFWSVKDKNPKRPLRVLQGHTDAVYSVAFSPDGQSLVSGSQDGTARVWNVSDGEERFALTGHKWVVESVAFSPDGERIATASWDKTLKLWDAKTGVELATLQGHTEQVLGAAFSPDGKTLASASGRWRDCDYRPGPGEIILWDVATGKVQTTLHSHTDRVFTVAFSTDGERLASASWDNTVKVWRHETPLARPETIVPDRLDQLLNQLLQSDRSDEQTVKALYLATLGRPPTDAEKSLFEQRARKPRQETFEHLLKVLRGSQEYRLYMERFQRQVAVRRQ